jgi:hypothetical protein
MTRSIALLRRIAPALALLVIAPLIAEFLLGDFNVRQLGYLVVFVPVYGTGALLVREVTRRTGRGWPTMLCLALAYALMLEGFINQTLFNPDYAGQHLLQYGFIPALGTSFNFAVYVLTLHVVWSIGSAVAIAEALAGERWREPWLRRPGLVVVIVLTLMGAAATASFTLHTFAFRASVGQVAAVAGLVALVIVTAFAGIGRAGAGTSGAGGVAGRTAAPGSPSLVAVMLVALILSSGFQRWFVYAPKHAVRAGIGLAGLLALEALAVVVFWKWSHRDRWGPAHVLAAATGAVLTYGWISLRRLVVAGGTSLGVPTTPIDVWGQVGLLLLMLALSGLAWRRLSR